MRLIAQVALNRGPDLSEQVAAAWDNTWDLMLGANPLVDPPSGIYINLVLVGRLFALVSIAIFVVQFGKQLINDESLGNFESILWPVLVILFLSNNGAWTRELAVSTRDVINQVNNDTLEITNGFLSFEKNLSELADFNQASLIIQDLRSQCNGITDAQQLNQC